MWVFEIPTAAWMLFALFIGIFSGYPIALVLAGVGIVFGFLTGVPTVFFSTGVLRIYGGVLSNWLLVAIPLYVFMGLMLEKSGIADRLIKSLASLFGSMPGGYAFSVVFVGIIMAASTGIIGASVVLLGLLAFPAMNKAGYDPKVSTGLIAATGTLGILIPPSIMLIILGDTLRVPVGDLFSAAMIPGLLLAGLYVLYLAIIAIFQPHRMPAVAAIEKEPALKVALRLFQDLALPLMLIGAVLGSIVSGIATPTESAGLGAAGAAILAIFSGNLKRKDLFEMLFSTTKTTSMIVFVMIGATIFSGMFRKVGGDDLILSSLHAIGSEPYKVLFIVMLTTFILGMFLDWIEITLVVIPLIAPGIVALDFGMSGQQTLLWFAIMFAINLQTSFLTPPLGFALFYMKGIVPREVSIKSIYLGIIPFVLIQIFALVLVILFPQLSLWLPSLLGK